MQKRFSTFFAVIVLVVGLFFGYLWGKQDGGQGMVSDGSSSSQPLALASVQIMIDFGNDTITSFNDVVVRSDQTVLSVLQERLQSKNIAIAVKEYNGLGTLVTKIGEMENGTGKKYWQYWVNGKHPDVGADKYLVKPGDVIEWKFTSAMES